LEEVDLRRALAPKVEGSVALFHAVEGRSLDFMLFLSSGISFEGNMGQAGYAAGCAFKDAFALSLTPRKGTRAENTWRT